MGFSISATQAVAVLGLLAATVQGHMVLIEPPPFGYFDASTKQSPLDPTGSDFPCKFPAGFTPPEQQPTALQSGQDANTMAFKGGATHGGGSCQISLTTDKVPTKNSKWEVIKSIEGGCPSDAPQNLSENPEDLGPSKFTYTVPEDLGPGQYTLAWTWFNKIGNREMYMNCAPVQIGGAAKRASAKINKKRQSARPDLFRANIGNGCSVEEGFNVKFPNPGDVLQVVSDPDTIKEPTGSCGSAGPQPAPAPSAYPPTAGGASDGAATGGNFAEDASPVTSTPAAAPTAPAPAPSAPAPAPSAPAAPPAPVPVADGSASAGGACSPEGLYICAADGLSYTRCASGVMSPSMPLAAGIKCVPGQDSTTLQMAAAKRSATWTA